MILGKGGPSDAILTEEPLEAHVLLGQDLVGPTQRGVVGDLGLLLFIAAFPRMDLGMLAELKIRRVHRAYRLSNHDGRLVKGTTVPGIGAG